MDHGGLWADLSDPETHQRLELNYYPPDSPYATPFHPGEGLDHLGFEVPSAPRAFRELVQKGARPALEPWRERNGVEIGYVTDPDGNWIEVYSRPRAAR
jgi:catechol 2,3-dioxygenase-like lactoylglutathione lyase family enzyme